jgi:formylglycine-generating enzyme required for sulfatase activity
MSVYCCTGSSGLASDGACSTAECDQNAGASRGPRTFRLDQLTTFFAQGGLTCGGAVRIVALPANMVPIAAGTFQMGSGAYVNTPHYGWTVTELPVHPVTISRPFWMGKHEVTQAEYQAVMGNNPSQFLGANRPVEMVSWNMAVAYCEALTVQEAAAGRLPTGYEYRLPTEAEWEYCCRAGTTTEWNVGSSMDCGDANFSNPAIGGYCVGQTSLVGSYPPNAWGLHDMHGNVAEWCLDGTEGAADYPAGPVSDPVVIGGTFRRMRGGGWMNIAIDSRSAIRLGYWPFNTQSIFGFRVVCAPLR